MLAARWTGWKAVLLQAALATQLWLAPDLPAAGPPWFVIKVVDEATGRGVPLVELETVNNLRFHTDSAGLVAFYEPGLMNQRVFFHVRSHGYEFPKDGFGYAGTALDVRPGGRAEIKIRRLNIAERLYRVTGEGIYRDSVLAGEPVPIREPVLNGRVLGQDSVMAVPYRGKLYWFWGDTSRPSYPLGNFHTTGAWSELPERGGLDPARGVDLRYFTDAEGFTRKMCPLPGEGMVWIEGLLTLRDPAGRERLLTRYTRMKSLEKMLEHGLAAFNDETGQFEKLREFDLKETWRCPRGRPVRVSEGGRDYFYFATPFCTVRVAVEWAAVLDPQRYQAFTCLEDGAIRPNADGRARWDWSTTTEPLDAAAERRLIESGRLKPADARYQVQDADTGKPVALHAGTVHWNAYRKKWILIANEIGGGSFLGEVWFSEADAPTGPWRRAKKIVTHDRYSFYNPAHHPFLDQDGGRRIYFEGTYSAMFSGNPHPTPRYDYNQVMYRLDLADPRLRLEPEAE